jgi:hypothetical protein
MKRASLLSIGAVFGLLAGLSMGHRSVAAQSFIAWDKEEVLPVVIVEPSIGGFVPKGRSGLQGSWSKDEVTPMCPVKPAIGGFVPTEGMTIGNTWTKGEVRPFVAVRPSLGRFVPDF